VQKHPRKGRLRLLFGSLTFRLAGGLDAEKTKTKARAAHVQIHPHKPSGKMHGKLQACVPLRLKVGNHLNNTMFVSSYWQRCHAHL
jgi:hypothetical protein